LHTDIWVVFSFWQFFVLFSINNYFELMGSLRSNVEHMLFAGTLGYFHLFFLAFICLCSLFIVVMCAWQNLYWDMSICVYIYIHTHIYIYIYIICAGWGHHKWKAWRVSYSWNCCGWGKGLCIYFYNLCIDRYIF